MSLNAIPLEAITESHLHSLVVNQVREDKKIEYKQSLPGRSNAHKREFLADVSSFANASGGDLLYGIVTDEGIPTNIPGLSISNVDSEILRLSNMIQSGIDPRIPGVKIHTVVFESGNIVIIIRIPRSWMLPHMVTFDNLSRFYSRNSAGKYQLDVSEIKNLVLLSQSISDRIRNFRAEHISNIVADETPLPLSNNPKIVLHLVPINAFDLTIRYDMTSVTQKYPRPIGSHGWGGRHNFDGFLTYARFRDADSAHAYVQVYRNGIVEAVEASLLHEYEGRHIIPSVAYERDLLQSIPDYLKIQQEIGVDPPILIMLSLIGVYGFEMAVSGWRSIGMEAQPIDRDLLLIPEVVLERFDLDIDVIMRPIFDAVWNAAGWAGCINYNEEGRWVGH